MTAFMCGGEPTPEDLAVVQEFAAALAQPTKHLQALALIEMGNSDEERAALAAHTLDDYPWVHPNGGRIPTRYGGLASDAFDPRPPHCQHRECYENRSKT